MIMIQRLSRRSRYRTPSTDELQLGVAAVVVRDETSGSEGEDEQTGGDRPWMQKFP